MIENNIHILYNYLLQVNSTCHAEQLRSLTSELGWSDGLPSTTAEVWVPWFV